MLIDLTHPLADRQAVYPGDPPVRLTPLSADGCNLTRISMGTHSGTHADAPRHFYQRGRPIDAIALERFHGPATLVDLGQLKAGTAITPEMLADHAKAFEPGSRVIYRTGWDRFFGQREFYKDYPTLTPAAAKWIAARGIWLLGMDTPGPGDAACHRILLKRGVEIVLVEALANLDRLPPRFVFVGLPLALAGRDGSPIRAMAVVDG